MGDEFSDTPDPGPHGGDLGAPPTGEVPPSLELGKGRRPARKLLLALSLVALTAVVALTLTGRSKGPTRASSPSPNFAPRLVSPTSFVPLSPLPPSPPTDLRAHANAFSVTLTWASPVNSEELISYTVLRDGTALLQAVYAGSRFVDTTAMPGHLYSYALVALSSGGRSSPVTVSVLTPPAPPPFERLEGRYGVALTVEVASSHHWNALSGWSFSSACGGTRHCAATLDLLLSRPFSGPSMIMSPAGSDYRGVGDVNIGSCQGASVRATLTIEFRVARGVRSGGRWLGTELQGTLRASSRARSGCGSFVETKEAFTATLLPVSADGVVAVFAFGCQRGDSGSGFIAAPHYVLTAGHVVYGYPGSSIWIVDKGQIMHAVVVLHDPGLDVAVLHVVGLRGRVLPLAVAPSHPGAKGVVIGYPRGAYLDAVPAVVTRKFFIHVPYPGYEDVKRGEYELETHVFGGFSGGPLVMSDGSVAGMLQSGGPDSGLATSYDTLAPLVRRALGRTRAANIGSCA